MEEVKSFIDGYYKDVEPSRIVIEVAGGFLLVFLAGYILRNVSELKRKTVALIFGSLKSIPAVQEQVNKEKRKVRDMLAEKLAVKQEPILQIPSKGLSHEDILQKMKELKEIDEKHWKTGKVSGAIYGGEEGHTQLQNTVYGYFSLTNPLHPELFPSIRKYEAEIIQMTARMMNGNSEVCGVVTSGGTESILMAVKTYRDKSNFKHPEMIIPVTAHAAFDKGASYFGIKIVHIPTTKDFTVDVKAMEAAITKNTIMIVGSAPQYAHGTVDPIPQLAAIAKKHNIGLHVDCCLGGFILPWVQKSGQDGGKIPLFDFRVDGVTSISADTHKYGYATKGTSVLLFKNEDLRRNMYFVQPNWPGGTYASPSMTGSRPGGVIACCWASLVATGEEGYIEKSKAIWTTAQRIKEGIKKIPSLQLLGDSPSMVVAFTATTFDVFKLCDAMSSKGWNLNNLQKPSGIHLCCTLKHVGMENVFLTDLAESVKIIEANPKAFPDGMAPIYGMAASFPDRTTVAEIALAYLDGVLQPQKEISQ